MIALYIIGGLIVLLCLCLLLPIAVKLCYDGEFAYKVKIAFVTLNFDKKKKPKQKKKNPKSKETKPKQTPKNFFEKLKEKNGFAGAIKETFGFAKSCIKAVKKQLKKIKFKDVKLLINVVGENAAMTAIDYGAVCSAVYPVLSLLNSVNKNIEYKKVDIKADFEGTKSKIEFSLNIKTSIFVLLTAGLKILNEYKNFSLRNDL